jgi:hypothetical protein
MKTGKLEPSSWRRVTSAEVMRAEGEDIGANEGRGKRIMTVLFQRGNEWRVLA